MYVFQMNNGRWQVDALTNHQHKYGDAAFAAPCFATRAEAEAWKSATIDRIEQEERSAATPGKELTQ